MDLVAETGMTRVGALLSTTAASLCASYILVTMIWMIRDQLQKPRFPGYPDRTRYLLALQRLFVSLLRGYLVRSDFDL